LLTLEKRLRPVGGEVKAREVRCGANESALIELFIA
jgi:hypothetical protein